jgi:DNA polymerase
MSTACKPTICTVDFETRSFLDVGNVGAWRYAEDWTTEILCMSWKFDDGPSNIWVPWLDFPQEVIDHVEADGIFEAHNVQFERAIWLFILRPQFGVPIPKRWRDTLATCAYRGLPLKLDEVGKALDLPVKKDDRGKYLLNTLSSPKFGTKKEPDRIYREDWDLMDELYEYCMWDADSEFCLSETVGQLPPPEYRLWVLDQKINQRGVRLDMPAVEQALNLTEALTDKLNGELCSITNNAVQKATQRDKLLKWFQENGLEQITDLKKETIEAWTLKDKNGEYVYKGHMPDNTLRALVIRSQLAKASTRKLEKMRDTVGRDGRVRGLLQYHGAGTGRWAGRLVQPQNFPRASVTNKKNAKGKDYLDMEYLIEQIMADDLGEYDKPMEAIASSLRGMFISDPGKVFHICDFSAIEARVTFWVANCRDGLDVFAKSDKGLSEDIYCVTASKLTGFEVKKAEHSYERQLGKITVLGCGYQMGWEKLKYQAEKDYGVVLEDHEAQNMVNTYREEYQEVKWLWYGLQEAAIATVKTGNPHSYNNIIYELIDDAAGRWLACLLPNGRRIWYYEPIVEQIVPPWGGARRDSLTYMGRDNKKSGSWGRVRTYGGMLTENLVQAIARDLMAEAMIRVEIAGYQIVLTVHDEIISEDDENFGSQEEFEKEMAICPPWARGCPVAVEGGQVTRYQKV